VDDWQPLCMASQALRSCPSADADLFVALCERACVDLEGREKASGAATLVNDGVVEVLCAWLSAARSNAGVQVAACRLIRRLVGQPYGADSPGRLRAARAGAVGAICGGMTQHVEHPGVQRAAASALLLLFRSPALAESSGAALDVLIAAMRVFSTDAGVNEACAGALRNLFMVQTHLASGVDGLDALVCALRVHRADVHVVEHTCGALVNLCATDANAEAAVNAGVLEALIPALQQHASSPGVSLAACLALHNLVWKWHSAQRAACSAGAVPVLRSLLTTYEAKTKHGRAPKLAEADASLLRDAIMRVLHRIDPHSSHARSTDRAAAVASHGWAKSSSASTPRSPASGANGHSGHR